MLRVNQSEAAWRANEIERASFLLDACTREQRGWEWNYLDQVRKSPLWELQGHSLVAYSPDGRRIAVAGGKGPIVVKDADSGKETLRFQDQAGGIYSLVFSPDGRRIASHGGGKVKIWDAATGLVLMTFDGHFEGFELVFSPDGRRIAASDLDGAVEVWDADTGRKVMTLLGNDIGNVNSRVAYSPDGRRIVAGGYGTIRIWDADTGRTVMTLQDVHIGRITSVIYSPDSRRIAAGGYSDVIEIWDPAIGRKALTLSAKYIGDVSRGCRTGLA